MKNKIDNEVDELELKVDKEIIEHKTNYPCLSRITLFFTNDIPMFLHFWGSDKNYDPNKQDWYPESVELTCLDYERNKPDRKLFPRNSEPEHMGGKFHETLAKCPKCGYKGYSVMKINISCCQWLCIMGMCMTMFPFCLIPLCCEQWWKYTHRCSKCKYVLGRS